MIKYPRQPLKHLAAVSVSNVDKKTVEGDHPVRLVNYTDVYYGDRITPALPLMDATATTQQLEAFRLRPGDVTITKDSETADDIGVAAFIEEAAPDLVLGYHLALLRPRKSAMDPRFLYWCMRSDLARGQLSTGATGVTRFGLRQDVIASVAVPTPALATQRAIAAFLDTETTRIDALIAKKRRMIDLLSERTERLRASSCSNLGRWKLKRVLRAPMAYGVLVPRFVEPDEGVPMARIGSLNPDGTIARERLTYIDKDQALEYRRTETAVGDLVLSVVGSMGRSAVVDAAAAGTNTNRPLARLQPVTLLPARLLWHWTQTQFFLDQARLATSGDTAQPTLNLGSLAEFDTGLPDDPHTWSGTLESLDRSLLPLVAAAGRLECQLTLLQEHRQALITAAVTGELDVPGVAA